MAADAPAHHGDFLLAAGALLATLAVAGVLFRRLRQSAIPAFVLVGMAVRPLVADTHMVEVLATLGIVLLLFFMGLEFSIGALLQNRKRILRDGSIDLGIAFPVGLVAGWALGYDLAGSLLLAGAFYVSSSAIIAKSTIELQRTANPETEAALGVLVFEDLFIAFFLAVLSGAVLVDDPNPAAAAWGVGKAALFFGAVVLLTLRARPLLDRLFDVDSDDLFLLLVGGVVLLLSYGAIAAGLSEAIGAFLAGLALAETQHKGRAERLFVPLQGLFATVFFLGFGLSIDPSTFAGVWRQALVLLVAGVAVKVAAGWWVGRRNQFDRRASLVLGLTLIARGEFSIVLAGIAVAAGYRELGSLIALLVLALAMVGTGAMQFAPTITQRVFPRRQPREPEHPHPGMVPELAGWDDEPPAQPKR